MYCIAPHICSISIIMQIDLVSRHAASRGFLVNIKTYPGLKTLDGYL